MIKKNISLCLLCACCMFGQASLCVSSDIINTYKIEQKALLEDIAAKTKEYEAVKVALDTAETLTPEEHQALLNQLEELDAFFTSANKELKDIQKFIKTNERTLSKGSSKLFTITSFLGVVGAIGYGVKKLIDMLHNPTKISEPGKETAPDNQQTTGNTTNVNNANVNNVNMTQQSTSSNNSPQEHKEPVKDTTTMQATQKNNSQQQQQTTTSQQQEVRSNNNLGKALITTNTYNATSHNHETVQPRPFFEPLYGWMFSQNPLEHHEQPPLELAAIEQQHEKSLVLSEPETKPLLSLFLPKVLYNPERKKYQKRMEWQRKINNYRKKKWKEERNEEKRQLELHKQPEQPSRILVGKNNRFIIVPEAQQDSRYYGVPDKEQPLKLSDKLLLLTYTKDQQLSELIVIQPSAQKIPEQTVWVTFKKGVSTIVNNFLNIFTITPSQTDIRAIEPAVEKKENTKEEQDADKKAEEEKKLYLQKDLRQQKLEEKLYVTHMSYGM